MAVQVLWTTIFIDSKDDGFERQVEFWQRATASTLSERRGDNLEFLTLLPVDGDPYVRLQRSDEGPTGIHLDLHVASPDHAKDEAVGLGASLVADRGHFIMKSPGGLPFCFVPHQGEATIPSPNTNPPHRLDQLCIDVPPEHFEQECAFWAALTGWQMAQSQLPEFRSLQQPAGLPVRFLMQRLDEAPEDGAVHAHLDIACGEHIEMIADQHTALGASQLGMTKLWMQMEDPGGLSYCLTPR